MDRHEVETHLVGDFDDTSLHELANREFPMSTAVLFVTTDARVVPPGLVKVAKITDSVEDALRMCASASFGAVFCDAASLANGGSGFRLGRQMRRNGIATPLFLMTNSLLSGMEGMAVASGATGFISRTAAAILDALKSVAMGVVPSAEPVPKAVARIDQPLPEIDVVIEGARILLRKYAGPVASMMVDDVLDELYSKHPDGVPVGVFAEAVAAHVNSGKARSDFLRELLA